MFTIRPYTMRDREFIVALAPRLAIGMQAWRDRDLWLKAVEGWLTSSLDPANDKTIVFVAENEEAHQIGFASVSHSKHFTGQPQAYIGELVTVDYAEGHGVGSALVSACEQWAREHGYALITLSTGAGNQRAISFYHHLGFADEDVTLTKQL